MSSILWNDLFVLPIPILEKIIRPVLVYFFLIIGLRLAGKRELAQLNPFDLVVILSLSNTVQNAMIGNDNSLSGGLIGAASLLAINYLTVRFVYRHQKLDHLLEGDKETLIKNGKVQKKQLEKELLTITELETAALKQGYSSLSEVRDAVLEPGGTILFYAKNPNTDFSRHKEIMARLDNLREELQSIKAGT